MGSDAENIAPLNTQPSQPSTPHPCSSTLGKRKIAETGSSLAELAQATENHVNDVAPPPKRSRLAGIGAWWPFRRANTSNDNVADKNASDQLADAASCVTAATNAASSSSSVAGVLEVSKTVGLPEAQTPLSPSAAARRKLWDLDSGHAFLDKREKAQYANVDIA